MSYGGAGSSRRPQTFGSAASPIPGAGAIPPIGPGLTQGITQLQINFDVVLFVGLFFCCDFENIFQFVEGFGGNGVTNFSRAEFEMPESASREVHIKRLTRQYQHELAELSACHTLLQQDHSDLVQMLQPYVDPGTGSLRNVPEDIVLIKQGLDLRLREFETDTYRVQRTEHELQTLIEESALERESQISRLGNQAGSNISTAFNEQQRLISLQQGEIDQLRFETAIMEKETAKLRGIKS